MAATGSDSSSSNDGSPVGNEPDIGCDSKSFAREETLAQD